MREGRRAGGTGRRRGITLIEVMIGVLVLALTVVTASALFPACAVLRERSGANSRAAAILLQKLEQVRSLGPTQLNFSGLKGAGVIDADSVYTPPDDYYTSSASSSTGASTATGRYSFTDADQLSDQLPRAEGTLSVIGSGTDLIEIQVTLSWTSSSGKPYYLSTTTYVADKSAWRDPS